MPMFYIGSSTITRISNGYHGSVKSKKYKNTWQEELRKNPNLFKTQVISVHSSREEALKVELRLQRKLKVVTSSLYINESLASPTGFFGRDTSGTLHPLFGVSRSEETRKKVSLNHADVSGSKNPRARRIVIISPEGIEYYSFGNFKELCHSLGLSWQSIYNLIIKQRKGNSGTSFGWSAKRI